MRGGSKMSVACMHASEEGKEALEIDAQRERGGGGEGVNGMTTS